MSRTIDEIKILFENGDEDELSIEELALYEKALTRRSLVKSIEQKKPADPVSKIGPSGESKDTGDAGAYAKYYNDYWGRNETIRTNSNYSNKLEDVKKDSMFQVYSDQKYKEWGMDGLWVNDDSDTGCIDDVSSWSPADNYAKVIWETFVCKADLFRIAIKGIAVNPGQGLGVQIRAYGAFGAPSAKNACECASCASITFKTYPVTLSQYNLEAVVCGLDEFDVGSPLIDAYLKGMSDSWAQYFDAQIYAALSGASPGTTAQLPEDLSCTPSIGGSCCSDSSLLNIYNALNSLVADMREGTGLAGPYNPDWLIISPSVAAIFKRMQTPKTQFNAQDIVFDSDGRLSRVAGLKVIEFCGATACTDLADAVVAIVVDSRRAVAAVFGQRPKLYKFFQSNCNSTRIDWWSYFGVAACDLDAIGHIINAS